MNKIKAWASNINSKNGLEHLWVTAQFKKGYARSHCGKIVAKKNLIEVQSDSKCKICKKHE